jgi:hypothetical protein
MKLAGTRLKHHPSRKGLTKDVNGHHVWTGEVRFNEKWLDQPLRWRARAWMFVCAHGDLFHEKRAGRMDRPGASPSWRWRRSTRSRCSRSAPSGCGTTAHALDRWEQVCLRWRRGTSG